ncbi:hypothetical protein RhiJN_21745 [Ceratobasidium sp. AG-Ba]|nr:hypothetical protein RhiJN_21745 [Ceratobasidium sp. AG-Ba]
MSFQLTMTRVAFMAMLLISLGLVVHASPIAAPESSNEPAGVEERGGSCYGNYCYGGMEMESMLLQFQKHMEIKLIELDGCMKGGNYHKVILEMEQIILVVCGAIKGYKVGLIGLLTGKLLIIAKIWFSIVMSIATHCGKWYGHPEFPAFCLLITKIDAACKLCLLSIINCGGIFGGFLRICIGLFTKAHVAVLLKIKFYSLLGALGIKY